MTAIRSWSLYGVMLPYWKVVHWASTTEAAAPLAILRLVSDTGAVGTAEVTVKPSWYGSSFRTLAADLEDLFLPMLAAAATPAAFADASRRIPEHQAAKTLVDNALVDLALAERAGRLPPAGGRDRVDLSWILSRDTPDLMAAEAARMVGKFGFRTLKLKGGQGIDNDLDILKRVQSAAGDGVAIYVDANSYYSAAEGVAYTQRLADMGVMCVEDPFPLQPNREFETAQSQSSVPILVDYNAASLTWLKLFAERGAQATSLKPSRSGVTDALAQAEYARSKGIRVHVGFSGESSVGTIAAARVAAGLYCRADWLPAEISYFEIMKEQLLLDPLVISDGAIEFPQDAPISGLVDFDKVKRMAIAEIHGDVAS
jgi:L-alanine-DL-glutamate epimerase-like enolase superfamily enzyme